VRPISSQEQKLLVEATQSVQLFQKEVQQFMENDWRPFVLKLRQVDIDWLGELAGF